LISDGSLTRPKGGEDEGGRGRGIGVIHPEVTQLVVVLLP